MGVFDFGCLAGDAGGILVPTKSFENHLVRGFSGNLYSDWPEGLKGNSRMSPESSRQMFYRVDRREVGYIRFIFEAYDGIAVVETIEPSTAVIALHVPPGCMPVVRDLVFDLAANCRIEPIADPGETVGRSKLDEAQCDERRIDI